MSANPAPGFNKYPNHEVHISACDAHVVVSAHGELLADSKRTLLLAESRYPAVYYIPLADVRTDMLRESTTETYCPFKGKARYFHVATEQGTVDDALWYYPEPYDECAGLIDTVACYVDKLSVQVKDV